MIINNVTLIDGTGRQPLANALVQLENRVIKWVGTKDKYLAPVNNDEKVIDGKGLTLLPGFINCHVHLTSSGGSNPASLGVMSEGEEVLVAAANAAYSLCGGVTTVRDCGSRTRAVNYLSRFIKEEKILGPRIVPSGKCITMTGGHGHWFGQEADGVEEVRKAVREEIKAGSEWIKVIPTGGVLTPGTTIDSLSLTLEELAMAVSEAGRTGRHVCAHALGNTGIKNALLAGVHSIEHGSYLDEEAIELMLKNEVYHVPTLAAYYQLVENSEKAGIDPGAIKKAKGAQDSNTESFKRSFKSGVKVALGSDAGMPFNPHGSVGLELELMIKAGVSPLQAISIGTLESARLLELDAVIGSIEVGKEADLVLVQGDPLENIRVVDQPVLVIKSGHKVTPAVSPYQGELKFQ